jgi:hypothetical protein
MIIDTIAVYQILRKLVTPFEQMDAYRLGIIDEDGNFLKKRVDLQTQQERDAVTMLDVLVINLKRLLGKLPGGKSRLASFAAALYLVRENSSISESNLTNMLFTLEEDFKKTYDEVLQIYEDAPMMSSGSGIVYGTKPGETVVTKKAAKKYKEKNILQLIRRVQEDTTLQYHNTLNPKIWQNSRLKDEVRGKLIQIADAWAKFANIPNSLIVDIIITGGNVNYNYTDQSDIDLHLVIDRNQFNPDRQLTDDYLQDKKILWTLSHNDLHIYGYPVELYAQDVAETPHSGQGVYSIMHDEWIQQPQNLGINFARNYYLQKKVKFYKDLIDKMISQNATDGTLDMIKQKIRKMRGDSIAKNGEFAFGNLVFKDLRNQGYLDKMDNYQRSNQDKALSLE